jgi:hypothetical protein
MKDAYFAHVARVEANRHVFADVGGQGERQLVRQYHLDLMTQHMR